MIDIQYIMGTTDSVAISPVNFTGDNFVDNASDFMKTIFAGGLASTDSEGYVKVADGDTDNVIGVFSRDGSNNPLDNYATVASERIAVIIGGCKIVTDQVVESNITSGKLLYAGSGVDAGKYTTTVSATGVAVGIARSKNSVNDKRLVVHAY